MKVNTFIVGVQKAGTTSLYEWLIQHQDVCGEIFLKDYPFFNDPELFGQGNSLLENRFTCLEKPIVVTGCVDYIENPEGLKRIKEYNPNAKIIVVLRNPEKRIRSAFKFLRQLSKEKYDNINDAIKNDPAYINRSLYSRKLDVLYNIFPKEQVKLVIFEQLTKMPESVLQEVFEFLGVPSQDNIDYFNANKTGEARFKSVNKILFDKESNKAFRSVVKTLLPAKTRLKIQRFVKDYNTKKAAPSQEESDLDPAYKELLQADRKKLNSYFDVEEYW